MASSSTFPVAIPPAEVKKETAVTVDEVPYWRSAVVLLMAGFVWIFFWTKPHATLAPRAGVVMQLPSYVRSGESSFFGSPAAVSEAEHLILPKDTEFARQNYVNLSGNEQIFCGIVLSGATDQSIHRPEVCLVGQGWNIIDQEDVPIKLDSGHILTVRNLTIRKTQMVGKKPITFVGYNMYWFVGQQVTTPYHYMRIFLSSWDRIAHNRANRWAYVTVSAMITKGVSPNGLDAAQTKAAMIDFVRHIVPTFQKSEMAHSDAAS